MNINSHLDVFTYSIKLIQYSKVCVRVCLVRACICSLKSIWEQEPQSSLARKCVCVFFLFFLHAVCIALRAVAERLLQGTQIRKGLCRVIVYVCDITESRMKTAQKNTEEILRSGKGETKGSLKR